MKKLLLYMGCAVAMLSACDPNDDFIDTLNSEAKAAGIDMPEILTLEEGDYSIVEKSNMFASKEEAANLVPQILTSKYAANASNDGGLMNVFYQLDGTAYFADLYTSDDEYTVTDEDYTIEFGLKKTYFKSADSRDQFLPVYFKELFKYTQKTGMEKVAVSRIKSNSTQYYEYKFNGTDWVNSGKTDSGFDTSDYYELTTEDYDSMGEEDDQPGDRDNLSMYMDVDAFLVPFLTTKYSDAKADDVVTIKSSFYGYKTDKVVYLFDGNNWNNKGSVYYDWTQGDFKITDLSEDADDKFVFKAKTGWEVIVITTYTLTTADYALTDDEAYSNYGYYDNKPGTFNGVEVDNVLQEKVNLVLTTNFPDAVEGALFEVTYNYYDNGTNAVSVRYQKTGDKFILVEE